MKTVIKPVDPASIKEAAAIIRDGGLVGMPTETVYGLAADALNPQAVLRIFQAKGRPTDNPLIVHVADADEVAPLVRAIPVAARRLMDAYWPGPMTLVLPKADCICEQVSAGLDTVGIRLPQSDAARALIRAAGCPIAAPSGNRSGRPSPTTAAHMFEDMDGRIPLILDGGPCTVGVESSVIDVTAEIPVILRPGGVTPKMVECVLGSVRVDEHVMKPLAADEAARSPGMKYRHYAPKAETVIYAGEAEHVVRAISARYDEATQNSVRTVILGFDEHDFANREKISLGSARHPEDAAARLFAALREADARGAQLALCEALRAEGIGLAVMNRMGRAAAFHIEKV